MKIGVLTYHRANNYGAYMQAYALCSRLNLEDDIECELIDYNMKKEEDAYNPNRWSIIKKIRRIRVLSHFLSRSNAFTKALDDNRTIRSEQYLCSDSLEDFRSFVDRKYDVIIVGSDELWKLNGFRGFPTPYWLPGDFHCRKFSYAVSSRNNFDEFDAEIKAEVKKLLSDFEYISVRDQVTLDNIRKLGDFCNIGINCDPSFLYDFGLNKEECKSFLYERCNLDKAKKTVVLMSHDAELKKKVALSVNGKFNVISVFELSKYCKSFDDLTPMEWQKIIAGADLVISSFFHGCCFSITNNTPFIAVDSQESNSKIKPLLESYDQKDVYFENCEQLPQDLITFFERKMCKIDNTLFIKNQRDAFDSYLMKLRKQ